MRPIIEILTFRFASTMPQIPHEYTARSAENEAAYVALFNAIQEHGRTEQYKGRPKKYFIWATAGNIGR